MQQIRFENHVARQKAQEKEAAMFRPSSGMKHSFNQPPNAPSAQAADNQSSGESPVKKIEENYGMDDVVNDEDEKVLEDIQEEIEENDSENEEVKGEIDLLKTMSQQVKAIQDKLSEKTQKIEKEIATLIEQSSDSAVPIPEAPIEENQTDPPPNKIEEKVEKVDKVEKVEKEPTKQIEGVLDSDSENENESEEEEKDEIEHVDTGVEEKRKIEERIKLLRQ